MNMLVETSIYEALTEAGVKPDSARRVERQVEGAITRGHDLVRAEMHEQLMTKAETVKLEAAILKVESSMQKTLNEQTWKLVTFVIAANGIMLAALKYIS